MMVDNGQRAAPAQHGTPAARHLACAPASDRAVAPHDGRAARGIDQARAVVAAEQIAAFARLTADVVSETAVGVGATGQGAVDDGITRYAILAGTGAGAGDIAVLRFARHRAATALSAAGDVTLLGVAEAGEATHVARTAFRLAGQEAELRAA